MKNLQIMNMSKRKYLILTIIILLFPIKNINAATISGRCVCRAAYRYDSSTPGINTLQIVDCTTECTDEHINNLPCAKNSLKIQFECKKSINTLLVPEDAPEQYVGVGSSAEEACKKVVDRFSDPSQSVGDYIVTWTADCSNPLTENNQTGSTKVHQQVGANFCSEPDVLKVIKLLGYILFSAKFLVPFILIVIGTMDYYKAVVSADDSSLAKQTQILIKRIVIGIIIFFLPNIVGASLNLINSWKDVKPEYLKCSSCLLEPFDCSIPGSENTSKKPTNTIVDKPVYTIFHTVKVNEQVVISAFSKTCSLSNDSVVRQNPAAMLKLENGECKFSSKIPGNFTVYDTDNENNPVIFEITVVERSVRTESRTVKINEQSVINSFSKTCSLSKGSVVRQNPAAILKLENGECKFISKAPGRFTVYDTDNENNPLIFEITVE